MDGTFERGGGAVTEGSYMLKETIIIIIILSLYVLLKHDPTRFHERHVIKELKRIQSR